MGEWASDIRLDDRAGAMLFAGAQSSKSLRQLVCRFNVFSGRTAAALQQLVAKNSTLTRLDVRGSFGRVVPFLRKNKMLIDIARAMDGNRTMIELQLDYGFESDRLDRLLQNNARRRAATVALDFALAVGRLRCGAANDRQLPLHVAKQVLFECTPFLAEDDEETVLRVLDAVFCRVRVD